MRTGMTVVRMMNVVERIGRLDILGTVGQAFTDVEYSRNDGPGQIALCGRR